MNASPRRPGISETTLLSAGVRYSDYPEPGSIEITYRDENGDQTGFKRWRRPDPSLNGKYYQEPGTGVHAYYPPFCFPHHHVSDFGLAAHSVVLLEGEFKTLATLELGIYAIGLPSFIVYRKDENGYRRLLDDLRRIFDHEKITTIYFLGDADTCTNFEFSRNAAFLARNAWKAQVFLPRIPFDQPKGVDDCKAEMGERFGEFFAQLIKDAIPLDRKCDETSLALILLEREADRLKALTGIAQVKQFDRIVKLCVAAEIFANLPTTARLRKSASKIMGLSVAELKEAIKLEKQRVEPGEIKKSVELDLVDKLKAKLPPIITRGEKWFVYQDGIWTPRNRYDYAPEALDIMPQSQRNERMASNVLRHIEGSCQTKQSPFCGACKFDGDDILVAVANGVLRIGAEITLEPASQTNYFTQKLAVPYDPKAKCPAFLQALNENLPDKLDRNRFWFFCASALVPDCRWEVALCCFGETGTGKSTLIEGVESMFGKGPFQSLSLTQLCDPESYNAHELEFAMLNFSTELDALELASDRFKQLVSGEIVPVRPIYSPPYYIKPTCKYGFLTNHLPRFKDGSGAELRRLRFIKFDQIPAKKDLNLKKAVATEGSGILNLILGVIPELLALNGLPEGSSGSEMSHERFKIANDPVGTFVATECTLDRELSENKDALKARFDKFLEHHGLSEKTVHIFFKQLYERFPVDPVRMRVGLEREQRITGITLIPVTESRL